VRPGQLDRILELAAESEDVLERDGPPIRIERITEQEIGRDQARFLERVREHNATVSAATKRLELLSNEHAESVDTSAERTLRHRNRRGNNRISRKCNVLRGKLHELISRCPCGRRRAMGRGDYRGEGSLRFTRATG
jgi:hypothetical protein